MAVFAPEGLQPLEHHFPDGILGGGRTHNSPWPARDAFHLRLKWGEGGRRPDEVSYFPASTRSQAWREKFGFMGLL
jgi:hypothetical protein